MADAIQKINDELGIKQKTIDGYKFEINLLPCGPAGEVFFKAMDIVGPSLGMAVDKWRNKDYVSPEYDDSFAEITTMFTTKLSRGELEFVIDSILEGCLMNGETFDRNSHLRGKFSTYMKLVKWALEENFSDFFTEVLRDLGLPINTWKGFMDMMQKQGSQDTTQETQKPEDTAKSS